MTDNILIIGKAKTGTTVISKSIQHSLPKAQYHLEPKTIDFFQNGAHVTSKKPQIVKLIYEHWNKTPSLRRAVINNEAIMKFRRIVSVLRDPRDELISRAYYFIYAYLTHNPYQEALIQEWENLLVQKENNPGAISFLSMLEKIQSLFGGDMIKSMSSIGPYNNFIQNNRDLYFLLKYEDFMDGRVGSLEEYLGFKLSTSRDVGNLDRTSRSRSVNNWKKYFTPSDVDFFKGKYENQLSDIGYDDWELEPVENLPKEHGSGYIRRLADSFL